MWLRGVEGVLVCGYVWVLVLVCGYVWVLVLVCGYVWVLVYCPCRASEFLHLVRGCVDVWMWGCLGVWVYVGACVFPFDSQVKSCVVCVYVCVGGVVVCQGDWCRSSFTVACPCFAACRLRV